MVDKNVDLSSIKIQNIENLKPGIQKDQIQNKDIITVFDYYNTNVKDDKLDEVEINKLKSDIKLMNTDENKDVLSTKELKEINIDSMKITQDQMMMFLQEMANISDNMGYLNITNKAQKKDTTVQKTAPLNEKELKAYHNRKNKTDSTTWYGTADDGKQYIVLTRKANQIRTIARDNKGNVQYIIDASFGRSIQTGAFTATKERISTIYRDADGKTNFYTVPTEYDKSGNGTVSEVFDKNGNLIGYEEVGKYKKEQIVNASRTITYYNADKTKSNTYFLTKNGDIDFKKPPILADDQTGLVQYEFDPVSGAIFNIKVGE